MARRYYKTTQEVYSLFKNHPSLSKMIEEFDIGPQGIKDTAEFLVNNDEKIQGFNLHDLYNWGTYSTLEPDQPSPNPIYINTFEQLNSDSVDESRIYYVVENDKVYEFKNSPWFMKVAEPDQTVDVYEVSNYDDLEIDPVLDRVYYVTRLEEYYQYKDVGWYEKTNYKTFSKDEYKKYQQETGFLIWENERGYYIFVEEDDVGKWEYLGNMYSGTITASIIRKSDLPDDGINFGDVYEVRGEDLLDVIAVLYGFFPPNYTPPWSQYESPYGTNLLQLLKFTLYYYRYATADNFYEEHIFDFIPEYDRNYILSQPKMKLFLEGVGRNLDNIEDKVSRIYELYDLDKTPEDLLDYVGQILGYEREDFTLADLSFRELLKNIIEIYKIKGTNYSFSFFFKFLGFNVNLKEFYFNRDVSNPESFPGIDKTKVEYYLTTKNPLFDTTHNNPAGHLDQIKNLNEWEYEYEALRDGGCENIINYMMGKETYNNNNERWHQNPWTYFKTNLIEYQLDPFMDKINLTASDNETIRKYITFLSPTYLFTWVNINLAPWIDTYNVLTEVDEKLNIEFHKTMGDYVDPETGDIYLYNTMQNSLEKIRDNDYFFQNYEDMHRYLDLYEKETNYQFSDGSWVEVDNGTVKGNVNFFVDLPIDAEEGDIYHVWGGEKLQSSIELNNPLYGNDDSEEYTGYDSSDRVGTSLKRDGTHIRQKNHPNYVDNVKHNGTINLSFDNLGIFIKDHSTPEYNYSVSNYGELPSSYIPINSIAFVEDEGIYYIYKEEENYWKDFHLPSHDFVSEIVGSESDLPETQQELEQVEVGEIYYVEDVDKYKILVGGETLWDNFNIFTESYDGEKIIKGSVTFESQLITLNNMTDKSIYYVSSTEKFFQYIITEPMWIKAKGEDKYTNWEIYSFLPFPSIPTNVSPYSGTILYTNNPLISWNNVTHHRGFNLEISYSLNFGKSGDGVSKTADGIPDNDEIILEALLDEDTTTLQVNNLSNGNYFWRIRTKNELDEFGEWSNIFNFKINALPHPFDGEELSRESENVTAIYEDDELNLIDITFKWEEVFEAIEYEIEISSSQSFDNIIYKEMIHTNSTNVGLPNGETYYWRVKALQGEEWLTIVSPHLFKTRF